VALRYAAMARELLPLVSPMLTSSLGLHVHQAARRGIIGRSELERGALSGEEDAVVCFADLVGFTSLGGEVGVEELGSIARQLADLATDTAKPPVRLVKTIGDAALFVCPDPALLIAAALELVEAAENAELPSLRAGIASGPVLGRAGDWYGHAVNLASRVTGVARPDSVLCTQEVRDAADEQFSWSSAGRFKLKGVSGSQPLHRARPLEQDDAKKPTRGRRRK
jgi:adenylate cyclase